MFGVKVDGIDSGREAASKLISLRTQEGKLHMLQGEILVLVEDEKLWKDIEGCEGNVDFYEVIGYSRNHAAKVKRIWRNETVRPHYEDLGPRKAARLERLDRQLEAAEVDENEHAEVMSEALEAAHDSTAVEVEETADRLAKQAEQGVTLDAEADTEAEDEGDEVTLEEALEGLPLAEQPVVALLALKSAAIERLEELKAEKVQLEELLSELDEAIE